MSEETDLADLQRDLKDSFMPNDQHEAFSKLLDSIEFDEADPGDFYVTTDRREYKGRQGLDEFMRDYYSEQTTAGESNAGR